jgi:hypothetical protein
VVIKYGLVLAVLTSGCATLTPDGARVLVYQAPLDGPPAKREMPAGCRLLNATPPVSLSELDLYGQHDPYRKQRNQGAAEGANALLVLTQQISTRRDFECPAALRITDCPGSSGAWFRVAFESYTCTPDALQTLAKPRATGGIPPG